MRYFISMQVTLNYYSPTSSGMHDNMSLSSIFNLNAF